MPTSEEILSKHTGERGVYLTHGQVRGSEALEAMEEYAQREAIEFCAWVGSNYYLNDGGFFHNDYQNKNYFSTDQLYTLYLQSKNEKP